MSSLRRLICAAAAAAVVMWSDSVGAAHAQAGAISIGPYHGDYRRLSADPLDPNDVLACSEPEGLTRSLEGGKNPVPVAGLFPNPRDLARARSAPWLVFAAGYPGLAYRSFDGGQSWSHFYIAGAQTTQRVAISANGSHLLVADLTNVFHSGDLGVTSSIVANVPGLKLEFAPSNPQRAYALGSSAIARSNDGGSTFEPWVPGSIPGVVTLVVDPTDADHVVAFGGAGVFHSFDAAASFSAAPGAPALGTGTIEAAWDANPPHPLWVANGSSAWRSTDGGTTFQEINAGLGAATWPVDLEFLADGRVLLARYHFGGSPSDSGLHRFDADRGSWEHIAMAKSEVRAVLVHHDGTRFLACESGVFAGPGEGALDPTALTSSGGAMANVLRTDPLDPSRLLVGGGGPHVHALSTDGASLTTLYSYANAGEVTDLAADPRNAAQWIASFSPTTVGFGLVRSTNGGALWSAVHGTWQWSIRAVAYDPHVPGRALALRADNRWAESADSGASWTLHAAWSGTGQGGTLAFDPWVSGRVLRSDLGSGWLQSLDGGATWQSLLQSASLRSRVAFSTAVPDLYWISNAIGRVVRTSDAGSTFDVVFSAPAGDVPSALALDEQTGTLVVGTLDHSAWEIAGATPFAALPGASSGSGDVEPRHFAAGGWPSIGNSAFRFVADELLGGASAWLHVGTVDPAADLFGGTLHTAGATIAFIHAIATGAGGAPGVGSIDVAMPIPLAPELIGLDVYSQVFTLDAAALQGIALSNGLRTTLQP